MRDTEITSRRVWTRTARGTGQQARFIPRIAQRTVYRTFLPDTAPGIGTLIMSDYEPDFDASFSQVSAYSTVRVTTSPL